MEHSGTSRRSAQGRIVQAVRFSAGFSLDIFLAVAGSIAYANAIAFANRNRKSGRVRKSHCVRSCKGERITERRCRMASQEPARPVSSAGASPVAVLEIKDHSAHVVRFLGTIQGLLTHWASKRSIPCPGPAECPLAVHRCRTLWKGYAAAEEWIASEKVWRPVCVQLTEAAEEALRGRELRGETWLLSRPVSRPHGNPVVCCYCQQFSPASLRKAFDLLPILLRFYHVPSLLLGVPNPLPTKVLLADVAGEAPSLPADLEASAAAAQTPEDRRKVRELLDSLRGKKPRPASDQGEAKPRSARDQAERPSQNGK